MPDQRLARIVIILAAIFAGGTLLAQQPQKRPYDQLMKDVAATYASVKKNLDASAGPAASIHIMMAVARFTTCRISPMGSGRTSFQTTP